MEMFGFRFFMSRMRIGLCEHSGHQEWISQHPSSISIITEEGWCKGGASISSCFALFCFVLLACFAAFLTIAGIGRRPPSRSFVGILGAEK